MHVELDLAPSVGLYLPTGQASHASMESEPWTPFHVPAAKGIDAPIRRADAQRARARACVWRMGRRKKCQLFEQAHLAYPLDTPSK